MIKEIAVAMALCALLAGSLRAQTLHFEGLFDRLVLCDETDACVGDKGNPAPPPQQVHLPFSFDVQLAFDPKADVHSSDPGIFYQVHRSLSRRSEQFFPPRLVPKLAFDAATGSFDRARFGTLSQASSEFMEGQETKKVADGSQLSWSFVATQNWQGRVEVGDELGDAEVFEMIVITMDRRGAVAPGQEAAPISYPELRSFVDYFAGTGRPVSLEVVAGSSLSLGGQFTFDSASLSGTFTLAPVALAPIPEAPTLAMLLAGLFVLVARSMAGRRCAEAAG